jgi:hypothetical protein
MPQHREGGRCPNCHHVIDHLNTESDAYEFGHCDLDGENYETDDYESNDNSEFRYICPDCGEDCAPRDVEDVASEEAEESATALLRNNRPRPNITAEPIGQRTLKDEVASKFVNKEILQNLLITCEKCNHKFESDFIPGDTTKHCNHCHHEQELNEQSALKLNV